MKEFGKDEKSSRVNFSGDANREIQDNETLLDSRFFKLHTMAIQEFSHNNVQTLKTKVLPDLCDIRILDTTKQIDYVGVNNYTQFSYDGLGRNTKIVETVSGSVTSTQQYVCCGERKNERRDGTGAVDRMYYSRGQLNSATKYFYSMDSIGSVRELCDNSGIVQAQYSFDPYGRVSRISELTPSDFLYAGYFSHQRSSLNLATYRAYNSTIGRWISRDPVAESAGTNLMAYVGNSPVMFRDPSGLAAPPAAPASAPPAAPPPTIPPEVYVPAAGAAEVGAGEAGTAGLAGLGPIGWGILGTGIVIIIIIIASTPHEPVIHPDASAKSSSLGSCYHSCRKKALEMYIAGGRQNRDDINKALRKCYDECEDYWGGPDGGTPCPKLIDPPEPTPIPKAA